MIILSYVSCRKILHENPQTIWEKKNQVKFCYLSRGIWGNKKNHGGMMVKLKILKIEKNGEMWVNSGKWGVPVTALTVTKQGKKERKKSCRENWKRKEWN